MRAQGLRIPVPHKLIRCLSRARRRQARCRQSSLQLRSDDAAIALHGMRRLRMHAAPVLAIGTPLQANPERSQHHPHQQDGHRRALKRCPQHALSISSEPVLAVIPVTCDDKPQARSVRLLQPRTSDFSVKSSVPALQMNPPSLQSGAHSSRPVAHIGTHANHAHRTLDLELWDAQFVGHCRNHLQTRHLSVSDDVR